MEINNAIDWFKDDRQGTLDSMDGKVSEAISYEDVESVERADLAIQALTEMAEREKGCEHCLNGKPLGEYIQFFVGDNTIAFELHCYDDVMTGECKINCCPDCGRKLGVSDV